MWAALIDFKNGDDLFTHYFTPDGTRLGEFRNLFSNPPHVVLGKLPKEFNNLRIDENFVAHSSSLRASSSFSRGTYFDRSPDRSMSLLILPTSSKILERCSRIEGYFNSEVEKSHLSNILFIKWILRMIVNTKAVTPKICPLFVHQENCGGQTVDKPSVTLTPLRYFFNSASAIKTDRKHLSN